MGHMLSQANPTTTLHSSIHPSIQLDMYEYDREGLHMYDGPSAGLSLNKLVKDTLGFAL